MEYEKTVARLRNCANNAAPCGSCNLFDDDCCMDHILNDAADAIECLCRALAAKEDESGLYDALPLVDQRLFWRRTDDSVPKSNTPVYVCYASKGGFVQGLSQYDDRTGKWAQGIRPAYWMPTITPPNELNS